MFGDLYLYVRRTYEEVVISTLAAPKATKNGDFQIEISWRNNKNRYMENLSSL